MSNDDQPEYRIYREAQGSELEGLTTDGWQLDKVITEHMSDTVFDDVPNPSAGSQPNGSYNPDTISLSRSIMVSKTKYLMYKHESDVIVSLNAQVDSMRSERDDAVEQKNQSEARADEAGRIADSAKSELKVMTAGRDAYLQSVTESKTQISELKDEAAGFNKAYEQLSNYFGSEKLKMVLGLDLEVDSEVKKPAWMGG